MPKTPRDSLPAAVSAPTELCFNCGGVRADRFCARCGQSSSNLVRPLLSVVWEFVREAFEVDGRVPRTLRRLFFSPGSLTEEFSKNRRARYTSPVRLYLFASFLCFMVLSIFFDGSFGGGPEPDLAFTSGGEPIQVPRTADVDPAQVSKVKELVGPRRASQMDDVLFRPEGEWSKDLLYLVLAIFGQDGTTAGPENAADDVADAATASSEAGTEMVDTDGGTVAEVADSATETAGPFVDVEASTPDSTDGSDADSVEDQDSAEEENDNDDAGDEDGGFDTILARQLAGSLIALAHDADTFWQDMLGRMPVAMFILLPVLAVMLKLFHLRHKRFLIEHLVFTMHVQTFSFALLTLCGGALMLFRSNAVAALIGTVFLVIPWFYLLIGLRRFYREGWVRTFFKCVLLSGAYSGLMGLLLFAAFLSG